MVNDLSLLLKVLAHMQNRAFVKRSIKSDLSGFENLALDEFKRYLFLSIDLSNNIAMLIIKGVQS